MQDTKKLKVGDILYITAYGLRRNIITRVTATLAMSDNNVFKREYKEAKYVTVIGSSSSAEIETPELLVQYLLLAKQYAVHKAIKEIRTENLTAEQCQTILDLLNNLKK